MHFHTLLLLNYLIHFDTEICGDKNSIDIEWWSQVLIQLQSHVLTWSKTGDHQKGEV